MYFYLLMNKDFIIIIIIIILVNLNVRDCQRQVNWFSFTKTQFLNAIFHLTWLKLRHKKLSLQAGCVL